MSSRRVTLGIAAGLAIFTYGTFLANYWPGTGTGPGLFGYAPNFLLSTAVGCSLALALDDRVADRSQAVRIAWYPALAMGASLPLYLVLAVRGAPMVPYWTYHLVLGGLVGVGREMARW